jgi:hypothetical protein
MGEDCPATLINHSVFKDLEIEAPFLENGHTTERNSFLEGLRDQDRMLSRPASLLI